MTYPECDEAVAAPRRALLLDLMEQLEQLPASRAAALRVVQLVDDPDTGAADVARAANADPALTARLLQIGNSAYYGLSGRVGTTAFAVTVVGFQTVRSLAAISAAGLTGPDEVPAGFWQRAAAAASAASLVARRVGAGAPDAFCAGLLSDLGCALLHRHDRDVHQGLVLQAQAIGTPDALLALESRTYGATHATLCADVLQAWHFPDELCQAIRAHHAPTSPADAPLLRALQAGLALVAHVEGTAEPRDPQLEAALRAGMVRPAEVPELVAQVREAAEQLAPAFAC